MLGKMRCGNNPESGTEKNETEIGKRGAGEWGIFYGS
jgi:hypothetical protein